MNAPVQPAPSPGPAPPQEVNTGWLVEKYRQLRDKKKEVEDRHKTELAPFKQAMEQIETMLLSGLNQLNANSVQTPAGTAYRTTRTSYGVEDPAAFRAWVEAQNKPEFYENRVSKEALEAYVAAGNPLPPGLKVSSVTTVNIRK
jgi:hypothetical protein